MPPGYMPLTNAIMQLLAAVILAVGTWAIGRLVTWLGLKNAAQATQALDDALGKAVTYGLQQSQQLIRDKGWDHPDVRSQVLKTAEPYLLTRFPDVLKAARIGSKGVNLPELVVGALDRAFPHAAAVAAASPATPPATAPDPRTTAELAGQPQVVTKLVESVSA